MANYGRLVLWARLIASPGVPTYQGVPRLALSWARRGRWLRLDVLGHGGWIDRDTRNYAVW